MYGIETVTPPAAGPVTAVELRARLRLNHATEDAALTEFLAAAVEQFEMDANRPVLATVYRQDLSKWPLGPIVLGRGGVTVVSAVKRYLADGTAAAIAATDWQADLKTPPARVNMIATPEAVTTAVGLAVSPVGCVEFTAGWANAAAVPKAVRTALMLLAGHYYEHREAYREARLVELPQGWWSVVSRYKLGVSGDWGQ